MQEVIIVLQINSWWELNVELPNIKLKTVFNCTASLGSAGVFLVLCLDKQHGFMALNMFSILDQDTQEFAGIACKIWWFEIHELQFITRKKAQMKKFWVKNEREPEI